MEVHHPHHPTHKKKLKEYFIEFFMLFTAVTLGFFAENVREIYVEKERAHEFIEQFKNDVKTNIAFIDSLTIMHNKTEYSMGKTMIELTNASSSFDLSFFHANVFSSYPRFLSKNDTYEQMKSSGSLRYIKDKRLLELMIDYSNETEAAEYRSKEQEASYALGTYADLLTAWTPPSIAIKRYLISTDNTKARVNTPDSILQQLKQLDKYKSDTLVLIKGKELEEFKKVMTPALARRLGLMKTTISFLTRARNKGNLLLEYLKEKH